MRVIIFSVLYFITISSYAQYLPVRSGVYSYEENKAKKDEGSETFSFLKGKSTHLEFLDIQLRTLFDDVNLGQENVNLDMEELFIVRSGSLKITIENESIILQPEGIILIIPGQKFVIENASNTPVSYIDMKYRSKKQMNLERGIAAGGSIILKKEDLIFKPSARGGGIAFFDRQTAMCERFEMHITKLNTKGPSHLPHQHVETEVILMISGHSEMVIEDEKYEATAGDFYYIESQLRHGISNSTDEPCSYFAFKWN